eukprot:2569854-Rhodomonas_salina.1
MDPTICNGRLTTKPNHQKLKSNNPRSPPFQFPEKINKPSHLNWKLDCHCDGVLVEGNMVICCAGASSPPALLPFDCSTQCPQKELLSILARCNCGFTTSSRDMESVMSIVRELEQVNPTPNPNAAPQLLMGTYELLFTDASDVLDIAKAPDVVVGEMLQRISCAGERVGVITTVNLEVPIGSKLEVMMMGFVLINRVDRLGVGLP